MKKSINNRICVMNCNNIPKSNLAHQWWKIRALSYMTCMIPDLRHVKFRYFITVCKILHTVSNLPHFPFLFVNMLFLKLMTDNMKGSSSLMEMCVQTCPWHYHPYYYFSRHAGLATNENYCRISTRILKLDVINWQNVQAS